MIFSMASMDSAKINCQLDACRHIGRIVGRTLRTFEWQTKSPRPDDLCECTESPGHTEDDGVVLEFMETVVVKQASRPSIDVRVRVLRLAVLLEDVRRDFRGLS